jgi:fructokinase
MLTIGTCRLGSEVKAMLFGAISLISEPAGAAYEEFMKREHAGRVMMLDPNIRPNFIPDKARHLRRIRLDDGHGRHRQAARMKT